MRKTAQRAAGRALWGAAAGLLALLSANPAEAARRALLIGVSDYAVPKSNLLGPKRDVRHMKTALMDRLDYQESEILVLESAQATKAAIMRAFEDWLIGGTAPGDEVFFYFSGHGSQVEDLDEDEEDGLDETLVPYDYPTAGHFTDDELGAFLDRLSDRHVTVAVDACHSGTGTRSLRSADAAPQTSENPTRARSLWMVGVDVTPSFERSSSRGLTRAPEGLVRPRARLEAWSAAAADQLAFETSIEGEVRGVFTHALIEALAREGGADADGDGIVTREEALEHLRRRSEAACPDLRECRVMNGGSLTPQLEAAEEILALRLEIASWPPSSAPPSAAPPAPARPAAGWIAGAFPQIRTSGSLRPVTAEERPGAALRAGGPMLLEIGPQAAGELILAREMPNGQVLQMFPTRLSRIPSVGFRMGDVWRVPDLYAGLGYSYDPASSYVAVIAPRAVVDDMRLWGERTLSGPEYARRLSEAFARRSAAPAGIAVWSAP